MKKYILIVTALIIFCSSSAMAKIFTDNSDGTVTDGDTNLLWQQGEGGLMIWEAAIQYCEGLTLAAQSDWRLPNYKELQSLVDYSRSSPALESVYFPGVTSSYYWSSTTNAGDTGSAWNVAFSYGNVFSSYKPGYAYYVRCVRGGQ